MYQLIRNPFNQGIDTVNNIQGDVVLSIPFIVDNTDYQQFKIQVADGTPLEDPDGNVMTAKDVKAFLKTLP